MLGYLEEFHDEKLDSEVKYSSSSKTSVDSATVI